MPYTTLHELEELRQSFLKVADDVSLGQQQRDYGYDKALGVEASMKVVRKSFGITEENAKRNGL